MILFWIVRYKIQLSDKLWIADIGYWVAVAIEAPLHRKRFDLCYDFHLVDSAVAGNATDTLVYVSAVIEVNKVRQVVDAFPQHWVIAFEAYSNRL